MKTVAISRHKDKGRSGGFGTRSRGVWVRNPTRSGIGCRDVTMPDRRPMEGNRLFSQIIKKIDSDTRVIRRSRPMTGRRASSTRIRRSRLRRCTVLPAGTQVLGPQVIGNEPEPLDSEKEVAMKSERSCAQDSACSWEPLHSSREQNY